MMTLERVDVRPALPMLLSTLSDNDLQWVMSTLQRVELHAGAVIQDTTNSVEYGYFVESGFMSTQATMREGKTIEVAAIGPEGFLGLPLLTEFQAPSLQAIVQVSGAALRITVMELRRMMSQSRAFERALLRYACFCGAEAGQLAACSAMHQMQSRLARWLLMIQHRVDRQELAVTHDSMAQVLGTNRATVSLSAEALKRAGLIHYARGRLRICDRLGLQSVACECYELLSRLLESFRTAELLHQNYGDGAKRLSAIGAHPEQAKVQSYDQSKHLSRL